jgi:putative flippase GtrA
VLRIARFLDTYTPSALVYLGVALASALVEWLSFYLLLSVDAAWRSAIYAFLVATAINYVLCRMFAFRSVRPALEEMALLFLGSSIAFVFNFGSFLLMHSVWNLDPMLAKIAGTGVGFGFNYLIRQFFIFDRASRIMSVSALAQWTYGRRFGQSSALRGAHKYSREDPWRAGR